jgi:hypothetical protein
MPVSLPAVHSLIELWVRREQPHEPDLPRALHIARAVEADSEAPAHLRGFAWHLVTEIHRAAGQQAPDDASLSLCRAAASSISQSSASLLGDIASAIARIDAEVLVLGALAASRALFDRWDLLTARGAMLIPLLRADEEPTLVDILAGQQGILWGRPGSLLETLRMHSREVELEGHTVRVPTAALIAARAAEMPASPTEISSFVFCAAAHQAAVRNTWQAVQIVARQLGREKALRDSAVRFRLDEWLGLQIPGAAGIIDRLRDLLRRVLGPNALT